MKKYDKYKDSGIEWIDKIPQNWHALKLGRSFSNIGSGTTPKSTISDYYENGNINWLNTGDLNDTFIVETSKKITQLAIDDHSTLKEYPIDSIVIALYGATIGKLGHLKINTTTNQACCVISESKDIIQRFLFYYFQAAREFIISKSYGGGQPNISQELIRQLYIPTPSLSEQTLIMSYLDHKTTQIDSLIEKKEQLIEKLKLQRQAIINEAVTKGLNPDAPMKDSGIEWLGEISENWSTLKIKHSCYVKGRIGWKGLKSEEYLEKGYSYLVTGTDFTGQVVDWSSCHCIDKERYEDDPFIQLQDGDLLLTKDGTIGKTTLVRDLDKPACLNSGIFLVRSLKKELDINFLYWILNSNVFKLFINLTSTGATIQHLYQNIFVEFVFAFPAREEQLKIQDYLFKKYDEFELLLEKLNSSIEKLKLYRQSIISEAVTGKIDVRDWSFGNAQEPKKTENN